MSGCYADDLAERGDCELVNELEQRGYEVYDAGSSSDSEFVRLYGLHVSGKNVIPDLIQIMTERANRII